MQQLVASDDCTESGTTCAPGTSSGDECINAFDDDDDYLSDEEERDQLTTLMGFLGESNYKVPSPDVAMHLTCQHDVAEYYSPPRVVKVAMQKHNLKGSVSLDLLTGWDFQNEAQRMLSLTLLTVLSIPWLMLSPPCTIFSELQRLWNFKHMAKDVVMAKWAEGMIYLNHSMACAKKQHLEGRFWAFEHPARASSWGQACVQEMLEIAGVYTVTFDQCTLGLVSKVHKNH